MNIVLNNGWFEIIEPKTKKKVFVNTLSGKCQWNPPDKYQQILDNQWWELYDFKSCHLYYYNVQTRQTSWLKPSTTNLVSLVQLQVIKNQKNKVYEDKEIQTSLENLEECDQLIINDLNMYSVDTADTSGYSTYKSNSVSHANGEILSNNTYDFKVNHDNHKESSLTLPATRKFIPRTNPNYTRHSQTLRLSQPVIGLYSDSDMEVAPPEQKTYISSKSVDEDENKDFNSLLSLATNKITFDGNNFPRHSVINAIDQGTVTNMEIWSRNLFNKSDSQLAGLMSWTSNSGEGKYPERSGISIGKNFALSDQDLLKIEIFHLNKHCGEGLLLLPYYYILINSAKRQTNFKSISDSLLALTPKAYRKKVCENFKQIQMYMGDREYKLSKDALVLAICQRGISSSFWANEIFMQLCKQVTYNPHTERTFYGWELICICLKFFHPESVEMQNCFRSFLNQYSCFDQKLNLENLEAGDFKSRSIFCCRISLKLLDMSNKVNNIKIDDVRDAKKTYSCLTMFYSSLEEVMEIQKKLFPDRKLPWIQVSLSEEIFRCDGCRTQGIFRIPSEVNKIDTLTQAIEKAFKSNSIQDINSLHCSNGCDPLLNKILSDLDMEHDPLLLSSILKNWFRHLHTPLIYFDKSDEPLTSISKDYSKILRKITSLPELNYMVLKHLIHFLQILSKQENVPYTNMPVENLVTLMAPTLFKSDIQLLQPAMQLLQSLIMNWDTSDIENVR